LLLWIAVGAGFGVLHVNTPVEVCRARNAKRRGSIESAGVEFVPSDVFERMVRAFEPPDASHAPWERNARALFQLEGTTNHSPSPQEALQVAVAALLSIVTEAARALVLQRQERANVDRQRTQQVRTKPPRTCSTS
jgi:tRNA uridine 5-carbamoylmethylation protein Kti12